MKNFYEIKNVKINQKTYCNMKKLCYNQIVNGNKERGEIKWIHHRFTKCSFANVLLTEGQIKDVI